MKCPRPIQFWDQIALEAMFITHLIGIDHRFPVLRQEIVFRPQRVGRPTFDQVIDEARNAGLNVFFEFLCLISSINSCNMLKTKPLVEETAVIGIF